MSDAVRQFTVAPDDDGLIQWIRGEALLPPAIRDILFARLAGLS